MVHLSTTKSRMAMIFYSFLTFFLGPYVTRNFLQDHPDQCIGGFLVGFTVSIILWMMYRENLAK